MNAQNLVKTLVLKGVAVGMLIGLPRMIYAADIVVPPAPCHPVAFPTQRNTTGAKAGSVSPPQSVLRDGADDRE